MFFSTSMKKVAPWMRAAGLLALLTLAACAQTPTVAATTAATAAPSPGDDLVTFTGEGFELDLPESFAGSGNPVLTSGVGIYSSFDGFTNVSVIMLEDAASLEALSLLSIGELESSPGLTVLEQKRLSGDGVDLIRITTRSDASLSPTGEANILCSYLVQAGDTFWVVTYGTTEASFENWKELFDQSAITFRLADSVVVAEVTQAPTEATPAEAPAFYTEEFDGDTSLWTYFFLGSDNADFTVLAQDGDMVFDIRDEQVFVYLTYDAYYYSDVRIDTRASNLGSNNNNVSLICRETEDGWYEFNIANSGIYSILRFDSDVGDYTLLYNGGSTEVNTGKAVNEYSAICEGDTLTLFINGVEERTVEHDNRYPEGRVGVSVSAFEFVPVIVHFEWLTISEP